MNNKLFIIALFLFVASLPLYVVRFTIGDIPTTLLEIIFFVFVALWLILSRKRLAKTATWSATWSIAQPFWIFAILLFIVGIISVFVSPQIAAALGLFKAYIIEPLLFSWILAMECQTAKHVRAVLWALGLSSFLVSAYAVVQVVFGVALVAPWDVAGAIRATSIYPYPNAVGLYVAPITVLFAGLIKTSLLQNRGEKTLAAVIAISGIGASIASESHGALAGIAAGMMLLTLFNKKRRIILAGWIALGIAALTIPATADILLPIITLTDVSGEVRRVLWLGTWRLLQDHGLWGAGLSGFPILYDIYREARHVELLQYPHMIIFNVWVELGLPGLMAFIGLFVESIRQSLHVLRENVTFGATTLAVLLTIIVHGLVDVPFFKNDLAFLTFILLLLPILLRHISEKPSPVA